jgi:LCP family protein required for cell wall assembly
MARTPDRKPGRGDKSKYVREDQTRAQETGLAAQPDTMPEYDDPGMDVESFVPTDVFPTTHVRGRRKHVKRRRALWAVLLICGILLLAVGGIFAYALLLKPSAQFADNSQLNQSDVVSIDSTDVTAIPNAAAPTPTPTLDPYELISAQADTSMMQNIVNVLLIGVDYAVERETWSGKHEYHADVMMVMAINFDENRVDLISLPRDTYAKIPGVKGIYKLNASLNCGGGFEAAGGAGFLKSCDAASWMLGGIPVNYYYAVTMPAVKQLVDTIGGVDYNLELDFRLAGRSYSAGPTHLSGQGVLDYLRVRKNINSGGDLNRVNRQKEMLIAIFESMQNQNLILKVPDIISSFEGQLFTNCTLGQTAALTKFAYTLDKDNIGMYSIGGTITNIFNWNFCLTDQSNRVKVIKSVYGIDVPKELEYTADYAQYRWADIIATQYIDTTAPMVDFVSQALAEDDLLPTMEPTPEITPEVTPEYFTPEVTATPTPTPTLEPTVDPASPTGTTNRSSNSFSVVRLSAQNPVMSEQYQQYSQLSRDMFNNFLMSLDALEEAQAIARKEAQLYANGKSNDLKQATQDVKDYASHVKINALELAQEFGYSTSKFAWTYWYDKDSSFNEVKVDFR